MHFNCRKRQPVFSGLPCLGSRSPLIVAVTVCAIEHNQNDKSRQRNKPEQQIYPGFPSIVQSSDRNGKAGQNKRQRGDLADHRNPNDRQIDEENKQECKPVFAFGCATFKILILYIDYKSERNSPASGRIHFTVRIVNRFAVGQTDRLQRRSKP